MIVWGGKNSSDNGLNTGGKYDPLTDSWSETSLSTAPPARTSHLAVWTGNSMIVWGGYFYDGSYHYPTIGGIYDPLNDAWSETPLTTVPSGRSNSAAVWTGSQMILWGGATSSDGIQIYPLNTGGILGLARGSHTFQVRCTDQAGNIDPTPASYSWNISDIWLPTSTGANVPTARYQHTAIWTGTEMIVWGGNFLLNSGGRYNPSTDSWLPTSTPWFHLSNIRPPYGEQYHTAIWTGDEMIIWGGGNTDPYYNTGGRYNPTTDTWIPTSTGANVPEGRQNHTAVWTGSKMIIWGGWSYESWGTGTGINTGGVYDPLSDSWTPTSTINAPSGRDRHTAVWTGSEMIIWGSCAGTSDGGRYNPLTDSWISTTLTNAPEGRCNLKSVWTGQEMIVWGGNNGSTNLNTGGRYAPALDSWQPTSTIGAPSARFYLSMVWTGNRAIVWGGGQPPTNTGGLYDPVADSWTATSITNAPTARDSHTAIWTGSEMIVWGGEFPAPPGCTNTGGIYIP
jgi:N-acetylneuraminic acid mutarotase